MNASRVRSDRPVTTINNRGNLANRHWRAAGRDAVLVEALDRHPVRLSDCERAQLKDRPLVGEALVGLVQLRWRDAPAHIVAYDSGHGLPGDSSIALVAGAPRRQAGGRRGARSRAVTKNADIADGEVRGADMNVLVPYEACALWRGKLDVRVRTIASFVRKISDRCPLLSVGGCAQSKLRYYVGVRRV